MTMFARLPLALLGPALLLGGCTYDLAGSHAPDYPAGYDSGMGSGLMVQPGDRFGGQNVATTAVFEAPLAPFGQWVDSGFGRAFRPDTPVGWRPYVNGRWGENRLWISDDPWGWATDHYGRWGHDDRLGWVWVPGTEWAPSWVAFRDDPAQNVAGWAPVPPGVNYSLATGFGGGWGFDSFNSWYGPGWIWVPRSYLYQPGFGGRVLPWSYGASYWGGSRWQYQPGWGGRPNWRRPQWGDDTARRSDGFYPGYTGGDRSGRSPRGGRPGAAAVPDRDGFIGYRTPPRANADSPGMAMNGRQLPRAGNQPPQAGNQPQQAYRTERPARAVDAAPRPYVERASPPERSEARARAPSGEAGGRPD